MFTINDLIKAIELARTTDWNIKHDVEEYVYDEEEIIKIIQDSKFVSPEIGQSV